MLKIKGIKKPSKGFKLVMLFLLIAGGLWAVNKYVIHGVKEIGESTVEASFQLGEMTSTPSLSSSEDFLPLPQIGSTVSKGTRIDCQVFAWNAQMPLMYANGGISTAENSLFAKNGINCNIRVQPNCNTTISEVVANCNQIKDNPNTIPLFACFMGDGMPGFSVALSKLNTELGEDDGVIAFYSMGRSAGEDGFWGPLAWVHDPQLARGKTVAGVRLDGDLNIVIKWCSDNRIPYNTNEKVYDPTALNFIYTSDYIQAGEAYIADAKSERVLLRNGKTVPDSIITVGTNSYTSWTPVDVTVFEKKPGLVRIASTKEYSGQMPNIIIVSKRWAYSHATDMKNIIDALGKAGDQVRSFPEALDFAGKVSAIVYKEQDKDFWVNYYKGVQKTNPDGTKINLGGSQAHNLADAANVFGLGEDKKDRYRITYETFANILADRYPDDMKGWMPYDKIVDKTFLLSVLANSDNKSYGTAYKETYSDNITTEVSNKKVNINFEINSATIKPSSYSELDEIFSSATIAEGLKLGIYGHTNADNYADNKALSEARAEAVANYLIKKGINPDQITTRGYGQDKPVFPDPKDIRNRCVEIVLGN